MSVVDRPTRFWQVQSVGEDEVAALPGRLELLLKVAERLIIALIAKEVRQKINAVIQEGFIRLTDIIQRSESQTYHVGPMTFEVFYGACDEKLYRAWNGFFVATHKVESPAIAPVNRHKSHKGMHLVSGINC